MGKKKKKIQKKSISSKSIFPLDEKEGKKIVIYADLHPYRDTNNKNPDEVKE